MRETDWFNYPEDRKKKKFIITKDGDERRRVMSLVEHRLNETKEEHIAFKMRGMSYAFRVIDKVFGVAYETNIISEQGRSDWDFLLRGQEVSEVLMTKRIYDDPDARARMVAAVRHSSTMSVYEQAAMQMILGKLGLECISPVPIIKSLSPDFDFPFSMFRYGMWDHFVDPLKPTAEEFLFAMMLEGVHGSTPEEKAAIRNAQILVERESYEANQG